MASSMSTHSSLKRPILADDRLHLGLDRRDGLRPERRAGPLEEVAVAQRLADVQAPFGHDDARRLDQDQSNRAAIDGHAGAVALGQPAQSGSPANDPGERDHAVVEHRSQDRKAVAVEAAEKIADAGAGGHLQFAARAVAGFDVDLDHP